MTMILAGQTAHFTVSYDDSITLANGYQASGLALAQAVLASCENDLNTFSNLFGGIMPAAASLPFQINLVPGPGGASHPGCLSTVISCFISPNSDTVGVPLTMDAEVAEVFMATQAQGVNCAFSNGEALSRVLPTVLYPKLRWRFMNGTSWLNSANPSRPDWVTNTNPTDTDFVSIGCGTLFYNYLAYQLNFSWRDIIAAGAPTLAQTAAKLGVPAPFANFAALLAQYFPTNQTAHLVDDDPFPLGRPGLYLRHNLADDGTSQTGPLATSPDIIVKNNPVVNPQATYSTPASINSDAESDPAVVAGHDNYVYLRVWNRGADATNVTAAVYWSPPATLVTPNLWNLIGSAPFADVPPGNMVQISDPGITWVSANIPVPGHYCFVATVGNAAEPAPNPGTFNTFNDFVNYIYAHNNITWRNFNVVSLGHHRTGGQFDGFIPLRFLVAGAWDKPHEFAFETLAQFPLGSRMALQVPHWLGSGIHPAHANLEEHEDMDTDPDDRRRVRIPLRPNGSQRVGQVELRAKTAAASHLLVHIPDKHRNRPYEVAIRQLYAGREVGRITWRLVPAL
jgi:hypothetical protein